MRLRLTCAVGTTGEFWRGVDNADLADYLREYAAGGYPVADVTEAVCATCGAGRFRVLADDEEGCVQRICVGCAGETFVADSADAAATLGECECPCGAGEFAVAVGFARLADGEVRWACTRTGRSTTSRAPTCSRWPDPPTARSSRCQEPPQLSTGKIDIRGSVGGYR